MLGLYQRNQFFQPPRNERFARQKIIFYFYLSLFLFAFLENVEVISQFFFFSFFSLSFLYFCLIFFFLFYVLFIFPFFKFFFFPFFSSLFFLRFSSFLLKPVLLFSSFLHFLSNVFISLCFSLQTLKTRSLFLLLSSFLPFLFPFIHPFFLSLYLYVKLFQLFFCSYPFFFLVCFLYLPPPSFFPFSSVSTFPFTFARTSFVILALLVKY